MLISTRIGKIAHALRRPALLLTSLLLVIGLFFLAAAPVQSVVPEQTEQESDPGETTPAAGAAAEHAAVNTTAVDPVPLETDAAAETALQSAWDRVKESGAYAFDADVLQKQRPLASITNVGRQTKRDKLHLEGTTDLDEQLLQMTLWINGGNVQDEETGSQIKVEGDQAYARQGMQPWQETNNFSGLFAPQNDFMAYLVAAINVQNEGVETRAGITFTRYSFDIDGPAYARHMRDQMEAELQRRGELPAGVKLGVSELYSGMSGSGELWIGEDGLPLRQIMQLEFAPQEDSQTSAEVTVNFKDFNPVLTVAAANNSPAAAVLDRMAPVIPGSATPDEIIASANEAAAISATFLIALLFLGIFALILLISIRSRPIMAGLQLLLIFSMLFSPLIQGVHAAGVFDRFQARARAQDEQSQDSNMSEDLKTVMDKGQPAAAKGTVNEILNDPGTDSDSDGYTDVEEKFLGTNAQAAAGTSRTSPSFSPALDTPVEPLPADDGEDTDEDGLTDYVEALLGTSITDADTDGDSISDYEEMMGFTAFGTTWYTDPQELDSNGDGIGDGQEWTLRASGGIPADSDNNQVPDLFDDDNDGDGVPDDVDLSPYTGDPTVFNKDNPFSLVLNELDPGKLTYVEFQLRPTNPDHIWYAYNVLDWPNDLEGNIQDDDGGTFPFNGNGDLQLIPMLELIVPDSSNNLLPVDLLTDNYQIAVQDLPDDNQALYLPLHVVTKDRGAANVAFIGKMVYTGAANWGDEHQVRLVWVVQALNDICSAFGDDGLCETYSEYNSPQVIHTYPDEWRLTGLSVRENHQSDVGIVFEDPAANPDPDDDLNLWKFSYGLDHSFLAGALVTGTLGTRVFDVPEIAHRFDHNSNGSVNVEQRWNISNTLSVDVASYTHLDEAIMTTVQTTTLAVLNDNFSPVWSPGNPVSPTLLFSRQDNYRNFNLDLEVDGGLDVFNWQNKQLTIHMSQSDVPLETASTISWAPYLYDNAAATWKSYPIEQYWDYLGQSMEQSMADEFSDPRAAGGGKLLAQMYYIRMMSGVSNIVKINEQRLQQSFYIEDKPLGASIAVGVRGAGVFILKKVLESTLVESTQMLTMLFDEVNDAGRYAAANPFGTTTNAASKLLNSMKSLSTVKFGLALGGTLLVVGAVIVGLGLLLATALSEESLGPARIATAVIVGAVLTYGGVIGPLLQLKAMASLYQSFDFGLLSKGAAWLKAAKSADSVTKGAKIAAGVGLVLSIGIAWGIFIYAVSSGGISAGTVAFSTLLAQAIAATILAIITFALSFSLVGTIIVAIFAIIDLLLFLLGVDFSVSGWITEQIGKLIFHFELTIDTDVDTGSPDLRLQDVNGGMVNGAIMDASIPVTTTITHVDPDGFWSWRVTPYLPVFYTRDFLRSTTFKYTLSNSEALFNVGRDAMKGEWGSVVVDHEYLSKDMYRATNVATPSTNVTLQTGINVSPPLYLNNSYAIPGIECWTVPIFGFWVPICVNKTIDGKGSSDIGSSIVFDVLPETLDGFVALDWGGSIPFPTQADWDNDGLRSIALNGNDPDDFDWDSDDDRLSDAYELKMRENGTPLKPLSADSDLDGLSDFDEMRYGTNPGLLDTDRDGLLDSQEVWHLDTISGNWEGGWDFTTYYTDTNDVISQTLTVHIFSDPLKSDADNDGITDGVEKVLNELDPASYPFHPAVFNETPVALYLAFSDEDGFVGLNQNFTISATVKNNLSSPLYAKGNLGLTLPPQIGDEQLTQEFNIFQAQASSIITDVTVSNSAANGPFSVTTDYFTRLHNGDLSWKYAWLTGPAADSAIFIAGKNRMTYASVAANPGPVSYDYAVGSLQAPSSKAYNGFQALGDGVAAATQAGTSFGQANVVNYAYPDDYHTSKIGNFGTDIVCNDAGQCAEAYTTAFWDSCPNVYFDYMHLYKEDDTGAVGEYGIFLKRSGQDRRRIWGWTDMDSGDDRNINQTHEMCQGDYIQVEEHDTTSGNEKMGTHTPNLSGPHFGASHRFNADPADDGEVYYDVTPDNTFYIGAMRLLNSDLGPAAGSNYAHYYVGPAKNPAVATSGGRWLTGSEMAGGNQANQIIGFSVNNSNGDFRTVRFDDSDTRDDHDLDIVWAGSRFLAVWERDYSATDHDIEMAVLNGTGVVTERKHVDFTSSSQRLPSVGYNPDQNQALVVYLSGDEVVGRFIEGTTVGNRFSIAPKPFGDNFWFGPKVAYEAGTKTWVVSYTSENSVTHVRRNRYLALSQGTLGVPPIPLTAPKLHPANRLHDLACNNDPNQDPNFVIRSSCAIVESTEQSSGTPLELNTIILESTPPWIGGGGGFSNTETKVLIVDRDVPTSTITSFSPGATVVVTDTFVFGGEAGDPTSEIAFVDVNISGLGWQRATGLNSWSIAWDTPLADGPYTIQTRATDVVGNQESPTSINITLDRGGPTATIGNPADQFVTAAPDAAGRYHIIDFYGGSSDDYSTITAVEATISPAGDGWQAATLTGGGGWTLDYVLAEIDENNSQVVNPTGNYTLKVRAYDALGNVTASDSYAELAFKLDTTPPDASLTYFGPSLGVISDTITLSGVMTDTGAVSSGIQQLEIDFVPLDQTTDVWTPVSLNVSGPTVSLTTWTHPVPANLEGNYLINLRGTDGQGNQGAEGSWWSGWQGEIDTKPPDAQFTAVQRGYGLASTTHLEAAITDLNLTEEGLEFPCAVNREDRGYASNATLDNFGPGQAQLTSLNLNCEINAFNTDPITLRVFDEYGHEAVVVVNPTPSAPPTLASTVLTPIHESIITTLSPLTVEGGAYAVNGLNAMTMTVTGLSHAPQIFNPTFTPAATDELWATSWTPPGEDVYTLVSVVRDANLAVQSLLQPVTVIVDTTVPILTLDNTVLTETHQLSQGRFELSGTAVDTNLQEVTVSIDGGPALPAELNGSNWRFVWTPAGGLDGATYSALIVAGDGGQTSAPINTTITVDAVRPQDMTVTTAYTAGSSFPVSAGDTVRDPAVTSLTSDWTAATDGSGIGEYRLGWTNSPTPTLSALTSYGSAPGTHSTAVSEATLWFGHAAAIDTLQNAAIQTIGPIVIDAPTTPDYINPDDGLGGVYRGWMESGCSLVGADYEVSRFAPDGSALDSVQNFYVTWDAGNLRLAWTGADWEVDGDLFIYLDTAGGGTTTVYNPYGGAGAAITLPDEGSGPMAADYLIFIEDGSDARLLQWTGTWQDVQPLTAPNFLFDPNGDIEHTDLYIPLSWLGSPGSMKMVALASEEESLRLWAAMPDHNPLNSESAVNPVALSTLDEPFALSQHYTWANAGASGVCPATGQFADSDLHFELTSDPPGVGVGFLHHDVAGLIGLNAALDANLDGTPDMALPLDVDPQPVGDGLTVTYELHYENQGTAAASGVAATLTAGGGIDNLNTTTALPATIPAGASGTAVFTADINPSIDGESAELQIDIVDAVHAPFDRLWMQHDIDSVAPTGVEIISPVAYIGAHISTLIGVVTDVSAVSEITLHVVGGTTQQCLDPTPRDGQWSCDFDAGGAPDGTVFNLEASAKDEWNNIGNYGTVKQLVVDTMPPTVALNPSALAKLADNMLSGSERLLSGTVTDDRSAAAAEICALADGALEAQCARVPVIPSGQLTGDWSVEVPIPNTVDGEIYTLTFTGIDSAGNRSTIAVTHIVTADFVGPTIQITTQPAFAIHYSTATALAGTIADNSGVAGLKLQINLPDNGDVIRDEFEEVDLGSGPNWSHSMTFERQGDYAFGVVGTDTYGNQTQLGVFKVTSVDAGFNVPPTADTGGPYEVNEGEMVTFGGLADDINAGQTLSVAWDMDGNGTFETPDILNPLFDATNIDGPNRRDIALRVSDGAFTTTVNSEVVIRNLPPSSDSGGPYEVHEGDLLTLNGSGTDPYYGDTVSYSWDLDEDDIFGDALGATAVFSATLIDGPEVISVTLKVTDDDDDFTTHTTAVTVTNVVPQLANLNALAITENSVATLNGTIVEPSVLDTLDMEVVWGDGRGSTATFATTTASAAGIPPVPGSPGGNQIVHLEADAFYEAGIQHRFENGTLNGWVSQDWSSYDGLTFWVYGTGSDTTLFFDLFDNRNPGSIIDDAERWRYEFDDPAPGWQQISAPFSQFEHLRTETGAPVDDLGLTKVWGWAFGFITSDGLETRFIDDVTLFNSTVAAASGDFERESQDARFAAPLSTNATSVVDEFENGLPSGSDSNGVAVGFSVHRDTVGGTFYYSYDAGTTNFSEGHLYIDDDDDDSFPVTLRIRDDDDENFSTFNTTIEVTNVAPMVNFSPTSQTIQYSDGIGTIDIVGTDVISDPLTIDTSWKFNNGSPTAGLMPGLSLTDDGCMGNGDYTQDCTWKVLGVADVPVGDYVITAVIEDDDGGLTAIDVPITVIHEDATALLSEYNPSAVPVADPGSGTLSEPFTLIATIGESEPDLAPYLAYAGDINLALVTMTLVSIDGGGPLTQSCTPQPVNPVTGYDDILTVSCDFDAVPLNIYTILLNVEGEYYQGGDDYSLIIYDPAGGYQLGAHAAALRNCAVTDFDLLHLHNYSEADCDIFSAGLSELGQNASLDGDILSFGDIIVRRDAIVTGDAVAAGTVQLLGGGVVNGAVVEGATVYQPLLPWAHTRFKAGTFFGDVTVAANGTRDLDPGSYHDLVLGQAAVLNLSSGNYRFNSMLGNFESEIHFDLTEGPVIIYVAGDAIFETEVKMFSSGSPREILFHVAGSQVKLGQTGTYLGTYVAPEAYIDLRDEATLTGALYGDTVDARPNSIINGLPAARLYTNLYVKPFYLAAQQQQLSLGAGWNMISSPIDPLFPALEFIFTAPQGDNLVLCKDGLGRVYWPAFGLNQIGDWNVLNGYKCYTSAAVAPTIVGEPVVPGDTPVDLAAGWSIMAYLRSTPMAVQTALFTIDGQVVLVKNGSGEVYWPNFGVNQIGNMVPGDGYEIYMGGPDQLIYPDN